MVLCDPGGREHVHAREATLGKFAQKAHDLYTRMPRWHAAICAQCAASSRSRVTLSGSHAIDEGGCSSPVCLRGEFMLAKRSRNNWGRGALLRSGDGLLSLDELVPERWLRGEALDVLAVAALAGACAV